MTVSPSIDSYRFGRIVVDGQAHTKDLIILPDRVMGGWRRQEGHRLSPADLAVVLETQPEVLVVGQGALGRMRVPAETIHALEAAGIELLVQGTEQACRAYNRLRDQKTVAAALHLTC
jgi:hypothetical protein